MSVDFSVMTWNLENLFVPGKPDGPKTQTEFDQKLANIVSVIDQVLPDVVALQEVGDEESFAALRASLAGKYDHGELSFAHDRRGIRVGYLARLALENISGLIQFPGGGLRGVPAVDGQSLARLGRGALRAVVRPADGIEVYLVTAHLKSKLLSYPGGRLNPFDTGEWAWAAGMALA